MGRADEVVRKALIWYEEWIKTDTQCPVCGGSPYPQHEDGCWVPDAQEASTLGVLMGSWRNGAPAETEPDDD